MTDFLDLSEQLQRVHSQRLALRPLALSDGWPLFEATRNPDFNKNLLWPQPPDALTALRRVETIMDASRRGAMTALSAVLKLTGEWVALYRFQPYEADRSLVEMGLWTHEKFWRDRYSFELTQACVDSAFALSDLPLLMGCTSHDNEASCRILERCGLQPTQVVLRQSETKVERRSQEFQITREHWLRIRAAATFETVPEQSAFSAGSDEAEGSNLIGSAILRRPAANRPFPSEPHDSAFASA
jgi:RimJ/RimL family protein N-acetyltransferase